MTGYVNPNQLLSLVVSAFALTAIALSEPTQGADELDQRLMQSFDANGDGVIDLSEANRQKSQLFDALDDDGDGAISRDEFMRDDSLLFAEFDLNRDGVITRREIRAARTASREPISAKQQATSPVWAGDSEIVEF